MFGAWRVMEERNYIAQIFMIFVQNENEPTDCQYYVYIAMPVVNVVWKKFVFLLFSFGSGVSQKEK